MRRMPWLALGALVLLGGALVGAAWTISQPILDPDVVPPGRRADAQRLEAAVRALVAMGPRDGRNAAGLDAVARHLTAELVARGGRVAQQPFERAGGTYRHVVARFGPESNDRIVVGAHYDTHGPLPGADDNASGVAALLELARLFGEEPPPVTVELVAFSLEEDPGFRGPAMGSEEHAEALLRGGVRVRAMFSLEMLGCFRDEPQSQRYPAPGLGLLYPTTGNFIAVVGRFGEGALVREVKRAMRGASPLPVHSINAPRSLHGVEFSDHASYWARGIPAVMITDTAFFRNPRYHTAEDSPDSLDYARMAMVVDGVHATVRVLAR